MKTTHIFKYIFWTLIAYITTLQTMSASFFDDFINWGNSTSRYCQGDECGVQQGIDLVWTWINDVETERSLSEYIQDVVEFALTFVSIIAVLYIIYAGFRILIGNGEEEQLKKSKTTIIYVIIGLIVMWLAWSITAFVLNIFRA